MRPFAFENSQVPSTGNELSAEWNERCRNFLAIEIEHCWIVDRLRGDHISLHNEPLSFKSGGSPQASSADRSAGNAQQSQSVYVAHSSFCDTSRVPITSEPGPSPDNSRAFGGGNLSASKDGEAASPLAWISTEGDPPNIWNR